MERARDDGVAERLRGRAVRIRLDQLHADHEPATAHLADAWVVARELAQRLRVGNVYVNRNMIGAVVGVQPFGGRGLSGTGPKAGGPHYLQRFTTEQTLTINTAAVGGNATLLSLSPDSAGT